jgi:hypothetical protein
MKHEGTKNGDGPDTKNEKKDTKNEKKDTKNEKKDTKKNEGNGRKDCGMDPLSVIRLPSLPFPLVLIFLGVLP